MAEGKRIIDRHAAPILYGVLFASMGAGYLIDGFWGAWVGGLGGCVANIAITAIWKPK